MPDVQPHSDFADVLARGFGVVLGRAPTADVHVMFTRYLSILLQWNRAHRLTAYRTPAEIAERLFVDSLRFLSWVGPGRPRLLDFGTGVGIPGLPMKIVEPRIWLTLLEARRRRVSFLKAVLRELGLDGVRLLGGRAEALLRSEPALEGAFDVVVMRAGGQLRSVLPLAMDFVKPGGRVVCSGPPVAKPPPPLPSGVRCRWEVLSTAGDVGRRRFLIAEKP